MENPNSQVQQTTPEDKKWTVFSALKPLLLITLIIVAVSYLFLYIQQEQLIAERNKKEKETQEIIDKQKIENAANDQTRKLDLTAVKTGLNKHYLELKKYPTSLDKLVPKYLNKLPFDPVTKTPYYYSQSDPNSRKSENSDRPWAKGDTTCAKIPKTAKN